jgi:uncharacterized protein YkwD
MQTTRLSLSSRRGNRRAAQGPSRFHLFVRQTVGVGCGALGWLAALAAVGADGWRPLDVHRAAPPAAPVQPANAALPARSGDVRHSAAPAALQLYAIGDPTDEEQYMLELVNRARRDPAAEAARLRETTATDVRGAYTFFNVDLDRMAADLAALPPAPPLAMNPELLAAARLHSLDMATKGYQQG